MPTCWDELFTEVARGYALAGAELLVYPTAIGSEPDHPDFDTEPLWRQVIIGHGMTNGLVVVPNRWGSGGLVTFYGSSFISDPTAACSPMPRARAARRSSPSSTCDSAATGSGCSRSSRPGGPTHTARLSTRSDAPRARPVNAHNCAYLSAQARDTLGRGSP